MGLANRLVARPAQGSSGTLLGDLAVKHNRPAINENIFNSHRIPKRILVSGNILNRRRVKDRNINERRIKNYRALQHKLDQIAEDALVKCALKSVPLTSGHSTDFTSSKLVNRLLLWSRNSKVKVTNFLRTATYMQELLAPITGLRPRFCTSLY